jgi:hypothetical protein
MKVTLVSILGFFLCATASHTALAQQPNKYEVAGIDDAAEAEKFFRDLQEAVAKDDHGRVAAMIHYPITVRISGRKVKVQKSGDLLKQYTLVLNRRVKQAVAQQKVDDLFVNWQGVMIGNGAIWFNQLNNSKELRITAINN